ncbi:MAG: acylphosphatase [candidate division Zixibacteria bacterium]|nr:acylphosphatase [candidate division Zixibacteria bacterium]
MNDSEARVHLLISGVVQGVGFRFFVERKARQYGLTGFARNLPDGRVEIEAEGKRGMLKELINDCQVGPSSSQVSRVNLVWKQYQAEFKDFTIA